MVGMHSDIAFTVYQHPKHGDRPAMGHWKAVKRLFCYEIYTVELVVYKNGNCGLELGNIC